MNRVLLTALALTLSTVTTAQALPPSGDANPGDRFNRTVDTTQIIVPQAKSLPPSGDLNIFQPACSHLAQQVGVRARQ